MQIKKGTMDYVLDLYRMKLATNINNGKKTDWRQFFLYALLTNHKKLEEFIMTFLVSLLSLDRYLIPLKKKLLRWKEPSGTLRLPYYSTVTGGYNDIMVEILKENQFILGDLTVHSSNHSTVNDEKTVVLDASQDIHFKLQFAKTKKEKVNDIVMESHNVKDLLDCCGIVFSYTKSSKEIHNYLKERYSVKKNLQTMKQLQYIPILKVTKLKKRMFGTWEDQMISKDFNNVFLEENLRRHLLQQIERFKDEKWFIDRGIPRTLGILLHGSPGCGKTSLIKALAAHFNRKIVMIDFKLVRTWSQLQLLFSQHMYHEDGENHGRMPCYHDSCIYVFDDFDCMAEGFLDRDGKSSENMQSMAWMKKKNRKMMKQLERRAAVMEKVATSQKKQTEKDARNGPKNGAQNGGDFKLIKRITMDDFDLVTRSKDSIVKMETTKHSEKDNKKDRLISDDESDTSSSEDDECHPSNRVTLSNFLEVLDGIVEMHGRIIIMTTNMRDKIDSALLRPGRIDLDLELKMPTKEVMKNIFLHMYNKHTENEDDEQLNKEILCNLWEAHEKDIKGSVMSTAQVMNYCRYMTPTEGLQAMRNHMANATFISEST